MHLHNIFFEDAAVFDDFYGMEEAIDQIVSYLKHSAQGLEEKKQILKPLRLILTKKKNEFQLFQYLVTYGILSDFIGNKKKTIITHKSTSRNWFFKKKKD